MTNRGAVCGKAACTVLILPPGESGLLEHEILRRRVSAYKMA